MSVKWTVDHQSQPAHLLALRVLGRVVGVLHVHVLDGRALQQRGGVQVDVVRRRREETRRYHFYLLQFTFVYVPLETGLGVHFHCAYVHL